MDTISILVLTFIVIAGVTSSLSLTHTHLQHSDPTRWGFLKIWLMYFMGYSVVIGALIFGLNLFPFDIRFLVSEAILIIVLILLILEDVFTEPKNR